MQHLQTVELENVRVGSNVPIENNFVSGYKFDSNSSSEGRSFHKTFSTCSLNQYFSNAFQGSLLPPVLKYFTLINYNYIKVV
jgi:hypothetical protein